MPSPHLGIADIQTNQPAQEAVANAQIAAADRAFNQIEVIAVSADFVLTSDQQKQRFVIVLTDDGISGGFTMGMFDTNERILAVVNQTGSECTIENSAGGGAGQPILPPESPQSVSIFHYDGLDFLELLTVPA